MYNGRRTLMYCGYNSITFEGLRQIFFNSSENPALLWLVKDTCFFFSLPVLLTVPVFTVM
jgi:hypothetical protein